MFKSVIETDSYEKNQVHYYLTQGDSCTICARPYRDGQAMGANDVEKCVFKLSNEDYKEEFSKELEKVGEKFVLNLTGEDTKSLSVGTHIYEIEYTLAGGAVQTPNQWKFDILSQITR